MTTSSQHQPGERLSSRAFLQQWVFPYKDSARRVISPQARVIFVLVLASFLALGLLFPVTFGSLGFIMAVIVFSSLNIFRLRLLRYPVVEAGEDRPIDFDSEDLPSITVVIPLKNEGSVVHATFDAVRKLDYPSDLLQVLVTVEENDELTRGTIDSYDLPTNFQVLRIPCEAPFTKGRALQYALAKASGEFLTIYDAESRPEPYQLQKAAALMAREGDMACGQAVIKIDNKAKNLITLFFAAEYIEWFYKHQTRIVERGMPIGLAGNSFFVATRLLREAGGWDMYNVTEDADLAVRLTTMGVHFHRLPSVTYEPCPDNFSGWVKQRIRWNKGLMVTKFLHLLRPGFGFREFSKQQWFHFWYRMLCGSLVPFAFFFCLVVGTYVAHYGSDLHLLLLNILMVANFSFSLIIALIADSKNVKQMRLQVSWPRLLAGIFLYWTMFLYAGLRSYLEYIFAPLRWHKTDHDSLVSEGDGNSYPTTAADTVSVLS